MPVKKYQLICAFLPAFLFALTLRADAPRADLTRTRQKADAALTYSKAKGYSTQYCILIEISLPAISNNTMRLVDPLLRKQKKPLLMWIYN